MRARVVGSFSALIVLITVVFLFLLGTLVGCYPAGYWKFPETGETIHVERAPDSQRRCHSENPTLCGEILVRKGTLYRIRGKGFFALTSRCPKSRGVARWGWWETLEFEDGTVCPVSRLIPVSVVDFIDPN